MKTNLFDKFLKKQRIETEPVVVAGLESNNRLSLDFSAVASSLYLNLSGAGWGASTVDRDNQLVLLFANDSSVSLKAAALQSFEPGPAQNIYHHQYSLTMQDLNRLSRYDLVGLRKYSFDASSEIRLPKENQGSIRRLSALFLATLKEANITSSVKEISVKDIRNYTGDSVTFCSKIYRTRYFQGSEDGPTLLDVQADFSDPLVNVVILEKDRQEFHNVPETAYLNREVCISGVVRLRNNLPYVVLRNKEQIKLTSPVSVVDAGWFAGDSVAVAGKVTAASQRQNGKTPQLLLNIGSSSSGQPLTVVVEGAESGANLSPSTYLQQIIRVSGSLVKT
ncbi:MAG TPA: hypothetical protein VFL47_00825, partial [Flavisolibacter sp.]|nr:hypothetical protein [Flavisolibacter sp.]